MSLIRLLRRASNEIQKHENNSRIAILTGSSLSVVGALVGIGSLVATFFTAGAALPITLIAGAATAGLGGLTTSGSYGVRFLLRKTNVKFVNNALREDTANTEGLRNAIERFRRDKLQSRRLVVQCGKLIISYSSAIKSSVEGGVKLGDALSGGDVFVQTFSTVGQISRALGLAAFGVTLICDIHTIVTCSIKVHKGKLLSVVQDIRRIADALEQDIDRNNDL